MKAANMPLTEIPTYAPGPDGMPDTSRTVAVLVNPEHVTMISPQQIPSHIAGLQKTVTVVNVAFAGAILSPLNLMEISDAFHLAKCRVTN